MAIVKHHEKPKLTTKEIQAVLFIHMQFKHCASNTVICGWERDFVIVRNSLYWVEYEIKMSRSDFKKDFTDKIKKHESIRSGGEYSPNYFYFIVPENLVSIEEVPDQYGLIFITETSYGYRPTIIKNAPRIHKRKIETDSIIHMLNAMSWKWHNSFTRS